MADARYWAAPGGVRRITRFALPSADDEQFRAQPGETGLEGRSLARQRRAVAALPGTA